MKSQELDSSKPSFEYENVGLQITSPYQQMRRDIIPKPVRNISRKIPSTITSADFSKMSQNGSQILNNSQVNEYRVNDDLSNYLRLGSSG